MKLLFKIKFLLLLLISIVFSCKKDTVTILDDVAFNKKADWFLEEKNYSNQKNYHNKFLLQYDNCIMNNQPEKAKLLLYNFGLLVDEMFIHDRLFVQRFEQFLSKKYPIKQDSILAYLHVFNAGNYHRQNDNKGGIFWAQKAIDINKDLKIYLVNQKAKNLTGNCYIFSNQPKNAIKTFTSLIPIAEQKKDYKSLGSLYYNVANAYSMLNAFSEADKLYKKSADSYLKDKDSMRYFALQFSRSQTEFNNNNDTIATLKYLDSLVQFHKSYKNSEEVNTIAFAELQTAKFYLSKNPDSAFYYNNKAMQYYQRSEGYLLDSQLYDLKIYYLKYKKIKNKEQILRMINELREEQRYYEIPHLYSLLCENAKAENNPTAALFYREKEILFQDLMLKENQKGQLFEFDKKYQSEKKEKQIAQQQIQLSKSNSYIIGLLSALIIIVLGTFLYSSRKRKQEAQAETKRQEQFTFQLLQNTEEERSRIANELHDSVNHDLLNIKNSIINGKVIHANDVATVIEEVRNISRNLHPAVLETVGLEASIENMCERLTDIGLFTTCDIDYTYKLSKNKEVQLYRIIQEALNNTLKHGKANAAKVILTSQNKSLLLEVKDNGNGFDVNKQLNNPKSFGLQSIMQRAKAIAAKININSSATGTVILLKIPT